MKEGWKYKKLGEVTTKICDGSHNPPKGVEHSNYLMLSSKNIFFDRFDYDSPRYLSEGDFIEENKRTNISDGDVLLTIVGTVGRTCCVTKPFIPFTLQRSVAVLKPQKTIITSRFLMYSLHSLSNIWESEAKGVAQKGVYLKQVSNISIPIPTITEQNDIVRELDLLSGVIEKQKAQLVELDKLAQSIFYDMFGDPVTNEKGWKIKLLGELYDIGSSKRVFENQWTDNGVPFYRAREIVRLSANMPLESPIYISEELYRDYSQKYGIPSEGDILVTAVGTLGVCYIVKKNDRFYYKDGNLLCLKNLGFCHSKFTYALFQTDFIKFQINGNANAAVVGTFTITNAKKMKVIYPPLSLQQEFAAKIEAIEAMKAKVRQSLKEAETLFNERMDYYFN